MIYTSKSYAKVNLTLDVLAKRADGYHDLQMILQTVSLFDEVTITTDTENTGITISSNLEYFPKGETNAAHKAAAAFFKHSGIPVPNINIDIKKNIPIAAGLAGGSSNAACVINLLNEIFKAGYSNNILCEIGLKAGADVPFCILGGTYLAEGVGEILTRLTPMPDGYFVLCKPGFGMSTPKVFSKFEVNKVTFRPDTAGMCKALNRSDLTGVAVRMYNVLEDVVAAERPELRAIKSMLLNHSALGAVMSGSGSTMLGLFDDLEKAKAAYAVLKEIYPATFLAKPR